MFTRVINGVALTLREGDIITVQADVIVNAANEALLVGGGVDDAIHRAAGPTLLAECRAIGGCPTGSAVATSAGDLPALYIFHAVGPIYSGSPEDKRLLRNAYQSCLDLAHQYQAQSIVFPALSTGAFGYPLDEAASIALSTVIEHLQRSTSLHQVIFALFDHHDYTVFWRELKKQLPA